MAKSPSEASSVPDLRLTYSAREESGALIISFMWEHESGLIASCRPQPLLPPVTGNEHALWIWPDQSRISGTAFSAFSNQG